MMRQFLKSIVLTNALIYWTNLHVALFVAAGVVKPLYWYVFTIASSVVVALLSGMRPWRGMMPLFVVWLGVFLAYNALIAVEWLHLDITRQALVDGVEAAALMFAFMLLFDGEPRMARWALLLVVLFGVPMNYFDFLSSTWTVTPGRAAGLYMNANQSGFMLVLGMVGAVPLMPQRMRLLFCVFAGAGVLLTFSRSSMIIWAVMMIGLARSGSFGPGKGRAKVWILAIVSAAAVYGLLTGGVLDYLNMGGSLRLTHDVEARLGGGGEAFSDHSTLSRAQAAIRGLETFAEQPVFGAGLGTSRDWEVQPHNLYVTRAAEGGVFGLAILLALMFFLWRRTTANGRLLLGGFALLSFFYHNGLDDPAMLAIIALVVTLPNEDSVAAESVRPAVRRTPETGIALTGQSR